MIGVVPKRPGAVRLGVEGRKNRPAVGRNVVCGH